MLIDLISTYLIKILLCQIVTKIIKFDCFWTFVCNNEIQSNIQSNIQHFFNQNLLISLWTNCQVYFLFYSECLWNYWKTCNLFECLQLTNRNPCCVWSSGWWNYGQYSKSHVHGLFHFQQQSPKEKKKKASHCQPLPSFSTCTWIVHTQIEFDPSHHSIVTL